MSQSPVKTWFETLGAKPSAPKIYTEVEAISGPVMEAELKAFATEVLKTLLWGRSRLATEMVTHDNFGIWWSEFSRILTHFSGVLPGHELDLVALMPVMGLSSMGKSRQAAVIEALRKMSTKISLDRLLLRDTTWSWARSITLDPDSLSVVIPTIVENVGVTSVAFPAKDQPCVIELYRPLEVLGDYKNLIPRAMVPRTVRNRSDDLLRDNVESLMTDCIDTTAKDWASNWANKFRGLWPKDEVVARLTNIRTADGKVIFVIQDGYITFHRATESVIGPEELSDG